MMKARNILALVVVVLAAGGVVAAKDFTLGGTKHLDVVTTYTNGYMWDSSTADVPTGGWV